MNSTGITVFLDVPPDRIVKRLMEAGDAGRPLLAVQNEDELRNRIHELWVSRLPYYQQASVQISAESVKPEEIQKIIMNYLKK
jgi:shikimate kinase